MKPSAFLLAALSVFILSGTQSQAQEPDPVQAPPTISPLSPGGVNMDSGTFNLDVADLTIGRAEDGSQLVLSRNYDSGSSTEVTTSGRMAAQGWNHNWALQVKQHEIPLPDGLFNPSCPEGDPFCQAQVTEYYVAIPTLDGTLKFYNSSSPNGSLPGTYVPVDDWGVGSSLVYNGAHGTGHFVFTDKQGAVYTYTSGGYAADIVFPGGNRISLEYSNGLKIVRNSFGYALLFEYGTSPSGVSAVKKACAVNTAAVTITSVSTCPSGAPSVQYHRQTIPVVERRYNTTRTVYRDALTSVTNAESDVTTYRYDDGGHVDCVIEPGQSQCKFVNVYSTCTQDPDLDEKHGTGYWHPGLNLSERVLSQGFATGESLTYSYPYAGATAVCPARGQFLPTTDQNGHTRSFTDAAGSKTVMTLHHGKPNSMIDPIGRKDIAVSNVGIYPGSNLALSAAGPTLEYTRPEGDRTEFTYDGRMNLTQRKTIAKPGSGQPDIFETVAHPSACSNTVTCNKPTAITDRNGNVTDFAYDPTHGGILRKTLPADDNGIRPETRYSYVQKHAWIKSGGGFVQAATPVWVLASEEFCRTSAADANGNCAAGASDEVVTTYEYEQGSASRGSNIWLVGKAVTADGVTLRSCISRDAYGRVLSETNPRANRASCQ